jgi:hypothetical protein
MPRRTRATNLRSRVRRRVVELVRAGRPVRVVVAELGLAEATVYGAHAILYNNDADATRAAMAKVADRCCGREWAFPAAPSLPQVTSTTLTATPARSF